MVCRELDQNGRYLNLNQMLGNAMNNVSETTTIQQPEINNTWGKDVYFSDKDAENEKQQ